MEIITEQAEDILMTALTAIGKKKISYRCLHMNFASTPLAGTKDEWFYKVVNIVDDVLEEGENKHIYLFDDGDVFVLAPYVTNKTLDSLLTHLSPVLGPVPLQGRVSLYEIPFSEDRIRALCARKKEVKKKKLEIAIRERREKARADLVSMTIPPGLVRDLAPKRADRAVPEILVVEDDPFSQRLVCNALKTRNNVTAADNGQDAVRLYLKQAPDIVFLDIGLPDVSGHDVLEKILAFDPAACIVMLSGYGNRDNVMKATETGAKGFVGKPFSKSRLNAYIEKCPAIREREVNRFKESEYAH